MPQELCQCLRDSDQARLIIIAPCLTLASAPPFAAFAVASTAGARRDLCCSNIHTSSGPALFAMPTATICSPASVLMPFVLHVLTLLAYAPLPWSPSPGIGPCVATTGSSRGGFIEATIIAVALPALSTIGILTLLHSLAVKRMSASPGRTR